VHPVAIGQQDDRQAVIASGLNVGDLVVTTGFARLTDGAKVQVAEAEGPPTAATGSPVPDADPAKPRQHRRPRNQPAP
jgi:multidrug efflux system membrane fusion protein